MKVSLKLLTLVSFLFLSPLAMAKPINLYDQDNSQSKVVGTIESESPMVPIFSKGEWMKVGDPKNGNVGWVHTKDFANKSGMAITYSTQTVETTSGPRTYQTVQFSAPKLMTDDQTKAMIKRLEQQQLEIQKFSQQLMKNLFENVNLYPFYTPSLPATKPAPINKEINKVSPKS